MKTQLSTVYYTPEELSALVRVPVNTLKTWRAAGYGPRWTTFRRRVRYPGSEVDAWLIDPDAYQDGRQDEEDST